MNAPLPENEQERLEWLRESRLLDSPAEDAFDDLTRMAAEVCGVPIAAVTLVDEERQWFKSIIGLPITETPRADAFCAHAILQPDVMVVPDAHADSRFVDNPLVTGDPNIRFYAGAPLVTSDGFALGSLCVIDRQPRDLTAEQKIVLQVLARQVAGRIELQRRIRLQEQLTTQQKELLARQDQLLAERAQAQEATLRSETRLKEAQQVARIGSWEYDVSTQKIIWSEELFRLVGRSTVEGEPTVEELMPLYHPDDRAMHKEITTRAIADGRPYGFDIRVLQRDGSYRWARALGRAVANDSGQTVRLVGTLMDIHDQKQLDETLERERQFLTVLLESLSDEIVACDETGKLRLFNRSTHRFSDLFDPPLTADRWAEHFGFYRPDCQALLRTEEIPLVRAFQEEIVRDAPLVIRCEGEAERHLLANGQAIHDSHGQKLGAVVAMRDVTASRAAAAALREHEQHLRLALESGGLGSWQFDLASQELVKISALCRSHHGLPPDAPASIADFFEVIHADDLPLVRRFLLSAGDDQDVTVEFRCRWPDGSIHWVSAHGSPICDAAGNPVQLIGVTQDVTERKRREARQEQDLREAQEQADRDPLTGLWNHRAFHRCLEEETDRAQRGGTSLAVVMLDIDGFKFFNDVYGHILGDQVLREVAERLRTVSRSYDTLARFGGDEFALLLPAVDGVPRAEVEARLRADLGGITCRPSGHEYAIPIVVSLGAALFPDTAADRGAAVEQADERLRRVKTGGTTETEADGVRSSALSYLEGFSMLDALVTAVDNKDRYTRRHSEDVMTYSLMIARALGLDDSQQHTVAVAALLHDVGKIGIPDAVLRKPGALSPQELETTRQHPQMGAAIVSTVAGLEETLDAVRHHHEHWNGGGYPWGLHGEETPLIARLMAVADAFSAMTTDRPYRQGMGSKKAMAILEAGAGTQWDPRCVAAFVLSWRGLGESLPAA